MLDTIANGFRTAKLKLQGRTVLSEENIQDALRAVRVSLLEADVELTVARAFIGRVRERAIGEIVTVRTRSNDNERMTASPSDHFIKICHDELVDLMGPVDPSITLDADPSIIMMVGLQGSGKTTTAGKLAKKLLDENKKPMLVAADIYRPAAINQLQVLGQRLQIPVFTIAGMDPVTLCKMALVQAKSVGRDVVIFDTAGRLAIDNELMAELVQIKAETTPQNIFFVCDSMIGQDAVRTAAEFDRLLEFTGFILTKLDGDARGGAALSIKEITGKPIKFLGMGEGLEDLKPFRPEGLADRILGFGDVVDLMSDFEKVVDEKEAEQDAKRMLEGNFTFDDFLKQIRMIQKMGSIRSLMERIPGMGEMMRSIPQEALDDRELMKVQAMIQSMTKQERKIPDIINDSRIDRIAKGSGRSFDEVQQLVARFFDTRQMMGNLGQSGMLQNMMRGGNPFGGMGGGNPFGGMGGGNPFSGMGGMPGMGGGNPFAGMGGMPGQGAPSNQRRDPSARALAEARKKRKAQKKARKKNRRK